ncbi:hypothetical protein E2C01_092455 [Portunus trituberculatus]|uniref:Uncharacterized protein n=1 Tax=Portunus trituberculatus TaxID=210409 RepID=A0A5B7JK50_PORTR|nr:hypothetical protein [Portunus trituberculatus]
MHAWQKSDSGEPGKCNGVLGEEKTKIGWRRDVKGGDGGRKRRKREIAEGNMKRRLRLEKEEKEKENMEG